MDGAFGKFQIVRHHKALLNVYQAAVRVSIFGLVSRLIEQANLRFGAFDGIQKYHRVSKMVSRTC